MSDLMTLAPITPAATIEILEPVRQERRRPGRIENLSPELIQLMRNPASREARVRVALYDAPGFLLPTGTAARRPRANTFKMTAAIIASGAVWGVAFKAMCIAWG